MSTAVISIAGVFEPGAVVSLIPRTDERQMRAGGFPVDTRLVDAAGDVGFDGLTDGDLYFVTGYVPSGFVEMRVIAREADQVSSHLAQPTDGQPTVKVGYDSVPAPEPPPAPPAADLGVGRPVGVPSPVNAPVADGEHDASGYYGPLTAETLQEAIAASGLSVYELRVAQNLYGPAVATGIAAVKMHDDFAPGTWFVAQPAAPAA